MGPGETLLLVFLQEIERRSLDQEEEEEEYEEDINDCFKNMICFFPEMCLMLCITLPACFTYFRGDSFNKNNKSDDG